MFELLRRNVSVEEHTEQRGDDDGRERDPIEQEQISCPETAKSLTNHNKDASDQEVCLESPVKTRLVPAAQGAVDDHGDPRHVIGASQHSSSETEWENPALVSPTVVIVVQ